MSSPNEYRHWRTDLHNLASSHGRDVNYEESCDGPASQPTWVVTARVNGVPYGTGSAHNKAAATRAAAKIAYQELYRELVARQG